MTRAIEPDYETQYLFPRSLEEWVGPDDPARFIREFVRELDLPSEEAAAERGDGGRPHYSFELLLSVWLYGYMHGIVSSRKLEQGCKQLLPLVWLAGTHQPDHNTLWRFWQRYHALIGTVFKQSVKVAWDAKLIGMVLHAVDGTKIASRASGRHALHRDDLERMMAAADQRVEQLEREIERRGGSDPEVSDRLPAELQKQSALRERIRASLHRLEEEHQKQFQPGDPESRMMLDGHGRTQFAYNAQAAADDRAGIIVAADVTQEANDQRQLTPMLDQVRQNVGENAETSVADSGYDTAEAISDAEKKNIEVVIASKTRLDQVGPFHTSRFRYDAALDQVQCPRGETLNRRGTTHPRAKPYAVQTYHCANVTCPVRSECSKDPRGRVIEIGPHHAAVLRARERLPLPSSREALRKRGAIIERVFAEIKEVLRFRRWTVTGKNKIQTQWLMICTAINLRRIIAAPN